MTRWRWRGSVALVAVCLAFFIYPLLPNDDVINSDWPAFATGARLVVSDPGHLYDLETQKHVQLEVTGGRVLVTLGIEGILPFLAPAWVALLAVPFDWFGTEIGGRLWILFGLLSLAAGLYLASRAISNSSPFMGRWREAPEGLRERASTILPGFAAVPTALLLLNAQLDGIVALGLGAAIALWSRPYLAGLALGLTLMKPQLVLPLGVAILLARQWKVLAGWAASGLALLGVTMAMNPRWVLDWLGKTRATVAPGSREVDLPHLGVLLPDWMQTAAVAILVLIAIALVLLLARRRREDLSAAAAVLIAGGVLAAPHALPTDLVLVALAMVVWGRARWFDWLALSVGAAVCALTPAPVPAFVGIAVIGWVCLRAAGLGLTWSSPEPVPASAR
jgi:glycosyl transferase family 87